MNPSNIAKWIALLWTDDTRNLATDDEAIYWTGEIFGTRMLQILKAGKFGVLRNLGWATQNAPAVTTWSTRKPKTYFSYNVPEMRNSLYSGIATRLSSKAVSFAGSLAPAGGANSLLTVTAVTFGALAVGQYLDGNTGVATNSYITAMAGGACLICTGTGGTGTYLINNRQTVSFENMSVTLYQYSVNATFGHSPPQDKDTLLFGFQDTTPPFSTNSIQR